MLYKLTITLAIFNITTCLYAQNVVKPSKTKQEKGYFNILEVGYFVGTSNLSYEDVKLSTPLNVRSLRTVNGWFLNPKFSLGLGVGVDGNETKSFGFFNTFIVYADARYYLKNSKDGWFFYSDLGKAVELDVFFEKGLFLNAGGGYKFNIGKTMLVPSLGYNQQNFQSSNSDYRNSSLAIKLGFLF